MGKLVIDHARTGIVLDIDTLTRFIEQANAAVDGNIDSIETLPHSARYVADMLAPLLDDDRGEAVTPDEEFAPEDINTSEPVLAIWEERARDAAEWAGFTSSREAVLALIYEVRRLRGVVGQVESLAAVWERTEGAGGMSPVRAHNALRSVLEGATR